MVLLQRLLTVCAMLLALSSCGDPPNTQILPIGSRCGSDGDCGTSPYDCATSGYPGGYCERTCTTDGDCPSDSICINASRCRRICGSDSDCRTVEGYTCRAKTTAVTSSYCDVPATGT